MAERDGTRAAQKDKIAAAALDVAPPAGGSVLLDAGTTTGRLAGCCPPTAGSSSSPTPSPWQRAWPACAASRLHLLGGRVRGITQAAVGEETLRTLADLSVDVAFLGTNGLSVPSGLSTPDPEEAAVKRAMTRSGQRVVVLADSSKIGRSHLVRFAPLDASTSSSPTRGSTPPVPEAGRPRDRGRHRMIVTLTANPSVDRTVLLGGLLLRGQVQRGAAVANDAGGKGVNVARAVAAAGRPAVAVLPGRHDDPLVMALRELPA